MFLAVVLTIVLTLTTVLFFATGISGLSLAPWVPSRKKDFERINRLAALQPGQAFYDLGCGDGRVCLYIAKKNPQSRVIGIEVSPLFYVVAQARSFFAGHKNVKIVFGNILKKDLSAADVIYTFGQVRTITKKLKPKLEKEMKKGARVLSYAFVMHNWKGKQSIDKPHKDALPIYTYTL